MANELLKKLAAKINAAVDIPVVPEAVEGMAIEMALEIGLGFLPPTYVAWIQSAADGVDDAEAEQVRDWLAGLMKTYSSVPDVLCGVVASAIVSMLRRGAAVVLE